MTDEKDGERIRAIEVRLDEVEKKFAKLDGRFDKAMMMIVGAAVYIILDPVKRLLGIK